MKSNTVKGPTRAYTLVAKKQSNQHRPAGGFAPHSVSDTLRYNLGLYQFQIFGDLGLSISLIIPETAAVKFTTKQLYSCLIQLWIYSKGNIEIFYGLSPANRAHMNTYCLPLYRYIDDDRRIKVLTIKSRIKKIQHNVFFSHDGFE